MEITSKPASKLRIVFMWSILLGTILFWIVFWLWWSRGRGPAEETPPDFLHSVVTLFFGGLFLVAGAMGYAVVIFSAALTFNYQRPIWHSVKVKKYLANIVVPVLLALGLGFALSAFISPVLIKKGLDAGLANLLPVMLVLGILQVAQLWVQMWAPLEKRLITKRLLAMGVTPAQLQTAFLVGLSDPASGFAKRFGAIEEDMGAMWVGPEQLIFWGDSEQFGVTRNQLVQLERKTDNRSTSLLGGIAHVILHLEPPGGGVRQIRLHTEGLWTMGQKRIAMDALAAAIARWHGETT